MPQTKARFIATTLLTLVAGVAAAEEPKPSPPSESKLPASSEPVTCYQLVGTFDDGMLVGLAVELCSGTTNAVATVACYVEAATSKESGGLGLNRGQAIGLCRTAGASARQ